MTIDINTFLKALFPQNDLNGAVVGISVGTFSCRAHDPERTPEWVNGDLATYVCVSSLNGAPRLSKDGAETSDLGRSRANCRDAFVFVLDDIGTKSATPPVEPSYKLRTSIKDGVENFQWGYLIEPHDVTTEDGIAFYEGACRAAGLAGISDPGMRGVYRLCRLPGSLHSSGVRAEIVEWEPKRWWKLSDLCAALGLDVQAAIKPVPKQLSEEEQLDQPDIVLDWLVAEGYTTGAINGDWVEIQCPNSAEHTDGSLTAGYSPLDYRRQGRQFKCFHGHCSDMDTTKFLSWVEASSGPAVGVTQSFYMSDVARANIQKAVKTELPESVVKDMQAGEIRDQILREWVFCSSRGMFFHYDGVNSPTQFVKPAAFNLMFLHLMPKGKRGGQIPPDRWWADQPNKIVVNDLVWHPARGQGLFTDETGVLQFNQYIPFVPEGVIEDAYVSRLWNQHLERLFGEEAGILLEWLAWLIQHPEQRIGWAPVLVGPEGCGKSIIVKALIACLGENYVCEVGPSAFTDNFNSHSEGKLLVVGEEIRVSGQNRYQILDSLKTRITNDRVDVRAMRQDRKTILNTASYLFCSNHEDCLPLDASGRRWAVFSCVPKTARDIERLGLNDKYFAALGATLKTQAGAIYGWLSSVDVRHFDPKGRAPMTTGTVEMIATTTDELYDKILERIESCDIVDANPNVVTNDAINTIVAQLDRRGNRDLPREPRWWAFMREKGWARYTPTIRGSNGNPTRAWYKIDTVPEEQRTAQGLKDLMVVTRDMAAVIPNVTSILAGRSV